MAVGPFALPGRLVIAAHANHGAVDDSASSASFHIEGALNHDQILKISRLEHLAFVANHVGYENGIVAAVLRPIGVDRAVMAHAAWFAAKPGTACELRAGVRVAPDMAVADVASDVWSMRFPGVDLLARRR